MPGTPRFSPEQLRKRRESIGASEAHDVVAGRWRKLWLKKSGRDAPQPDSDDAIFGRMMESAVLTEYERVTGHAVARQAHARHPSQPHVTATPDGVVPNGDDIARVVEVKCPRYLTGWGPEGSRAIPPRVWWQIQHQMACTGAPVADVVLLAYRTVRIYRDIPRDDEAIAALLSEIQWGWATYIAADVMPPPDDSDECATHLAQLYPHASEGREMIDTEDAEVVEAARTYQRAKLAADEAESTKRRAKAALVGRIGNAYGIAGKWGQATFSNVAGRKKVDHDAVCMALAAEAGHGAEAARARIAELAENHTKQQPGFRRLEVVLPEDT